MPMPRACYARRGTRPTPVPAPAPAQASRVLDASSISSRMPTTAVLSMAWAAPRNSSRLETCAVHAELDVDEKGIADVGPRCVPALCFWDCTWSGCGG